MIDGIDDSVREALPATIRVGPGITLAHGEDGVEQKHALIGPLFQAATGRTCEGGDVGLEFLEDVEQRRGRVNTWGDREAHAVSLARLVVRILADDDDAGADEGGVVEGREDVFGRWVDSAGGTLSGDEFDEGVPKRLAYSVVKRVPPCGLQTRFQGRLTSKVGVDLRQTFGTGSSTIGLNAGLHFRGYDLFLQLLYCT